MLTIKLLTIYSWIISRQRIHDKTASRNSWDKSYDFIVVGAGTAGCTVAKRLSENLIVRVLLLEVGGAQSAIYNDIPVMANYITENRPDLEWLYYNVPQINAGKQFPGGRIFEPKGKTIGGSSTHNQMIYNRGNRKDYDAWAQEYGAIGWSYNEILPFLKLYENNTERKIVEENPEYHGTGGPIQVSSQKRVPRILSLLKNSFNENGFENNTDFNGPKQTGTMNFQLYITKDGFRSSHGKGYVDPNPYPNNLHIVAKALVTKILFNDMTAVGVEFAKNDKPFKVFAQKEVILTAGAINSPQILMLSGIGVKSHLESLNIPVRKELPVGNNFMNHPNVLIGSQILDPLLYDPFPELNIKSMFELYFLSQGPLSEHPTTGLYFSTSSVKDKRWPNMQLNSFVQNDTLFYI